MSGKKLCPKIILEGTRLTHKTDLAFTLNEHPRIVGPRHYRYHSPIISAEWCAFTNFPWGRGLINFKPSEMDLALETYSTWVRLFELQCYYSWIIDRFHISTKLFQARENNIDLDFMWLEERMKALGFCLVLCLRSPETFEQARNDRIKVSGNPDQYDDLHIFVEEQKRFKSITADSILPTIEIDVSDGKLNAAADKIADWMEENQLLWVEDDIR